MDEGRNLLARMPKLEAQRALRKDYQALADGKLTIDDFIGDRERILSGMKLRRTAAVNFAQKVMEAIGQIKEGVHQGSGHGRDGGVGHQGRLPAHRREGAARHQGSPGQGRRGSAQPT